MRLAGFTRYVLAPMEKVSATRSRSLANKEDSNTCSAARGHLATIMKMGAGVSNLGTGADLTDYIAKFAYAGAGGDRLSFSASQTTDAGDRAGQPGPGGISFIRPDFAGTVSGPNSLVEALSERTSYTLIYTDEQPDGWFAPTVQLSYNEQVIDASGVYGVNNSLSGVFKNEFQLSNGTLNAGIDFFDDSAEGLGRGPGGICQFGARRPK